jgi:hypothetical protein
LRFCTEREFELPASAPDGGEQRSEVDRPLDRFLIPLISARINIDADAIPPQFGALTN